MSNGGGGPGPPDTGQFTNVFSYVRGALDVINQSGEPMDINQHVLNNYSSKRPGDVINNSIMPAPKIQNTLTNNNNVIVPNVALNQVPITSNMTSASNNTSDTEPGLVPGDKPNEDVQVRIKSKYKITDTGPYYVYVQQKNNRRLHPMFIGKLLYKGEFQNKDMIGSIEAVGKYKVKVEIKNSIVANKLTTLELLNNDELDTYIPSFNLHKQGVVRHIDTSITDDEIMNFITSEFKVIAVRRIYRRTDSERKPTQTCVLKFEGQQIPNYITLFGTRCEVAPYISPVIQCYKCLRYGHLSLQCKSRLRCSKCSGEHNVEECTATNMSCVHCEGDHLSTNRNCPEFTLQKNIKRLMALNNLSYAEAAREFKSSYYNIASQQRPDPKSYVDFPQTISNNEPSTSSGLTHTQGYSQQKKNFRFTKQIISKPKAPTSRPPNPQLPVANHVTITPSNPIQNPYAPRYSTGTPERTRFNLFDNIKQKIVSLIEIAIEKTKNNVPVTGNELIAQLNNLDLSSIT